MEKARIVLLKPTGNQPSTVDQSLGARLSATQGPVRHRIRFEEESFRRGDLEDLERSLLRWSGKVSGVVGATSVPESIRLGELSEQAGLLCFVSNNNPIVRQARRLTFHIGIPTSLTSKAVACHLLRDVGVRRIYILYDETDFQKRAALYTELELKNGGAAVRSRPASENGWLEDLRAWTPEALYLVCSEQSLALPLVQTIRQALPGLILLLGRSLLRHTFLQALGPAPERLFLIDLFKRGAAGTEREATFFKAVAQAGIDIPTSNHGFGWDAMALCGLALLAGNGDPLSAVSYLESGIDIDGATGRYRFSLEDHNGRAGFNPTTLSTIYHGRLEMYPEGNRGTLYQP